MMDKITCKIKRLPHGEGLPLPEYKSAGAAGMDLSAAIREAITLAAGAHLAVPTGFALEIPQGYEAQIRPRSGLAVKHGVGLTNAPGTIDCDYRGEVMVLLVNHGKDDVEIKRGERIAQMVFAPVIHAELVETEMLDDTERGSSGFGSTGRGAK